MKGEIKWSIDRWHWSSLPLWPISLHIIRGQDRDLERSRKILRRVFRNYVLHILWNAWLSALCEMRSFIDWTVTISKGGERNLNVGSQAKEQHKEITRYVWKEGYSVRKLTWTFQWDSDQKMRGCPILNGVFCVFFARNDKMSFVVLFSILRNQVKRSFGDGICSR